MMIRVDTFSDADLAGSKKRPSCKISLSSIVGGNLVGNKIEAIYLVK